MLEGRLIFRVSLDGAEDVSREKTLATSEAVPVEKELLVNLDDCPLPSRNSDQHAFFESLDLGKSLPSSGRMLAVVSDDNFHSTLKTRVIALSVRMRTSTPLSKAFTC